MDKIKHIIKNITMWELKKNQKKAKTIADFEFSIFVYASAHVRRVDTT